MLEDIINKGFLEMADRPFAVVSGLASWGDSLPVRILVVVSVVLFLFFATDIIRIAPFIIDCVVRSKANASLEHSISTARIRNEVSALMIIPFCLVVDRFCLYTPSFVNAVRPDMTVLCIIGVMLAYLLLRLVCFATFKPLRQTSECLATIKHIPFNFFIALVPVMLVTVGVFAVFRAPDSLIKTVLLWETASFYLMSVFNILLFLSRRCTIFVTFLYLCALEFLPTGLLLASEFVL